jgi:hypothetical protein
MSAPPFTLARNAAVRMHIQDRQFLVCIARPPLDATPEAIFGPDRGLMHAFLTHDAGCDWPDATGVQLMDRALSSDGAVILSFLTLGDALSAQQRLRRAVEA